MKTLHFKLFLLMFLTSIAITAQKETIYTKSFKTNKYTTALLKLSGGLVEIELSPDDNFHAEYHIEFENFPERKKKGIIDKVKIEANINDNHIKLADKSEFHFYGRYFIENYLIKKNSTKEKTYIQKSKKSILEEINDNRLQKSLYVSLIKNSNNYSEKKKEELISRYEKKKKKRHKKTLVIKIPSSLNLTIDAKRTTIKINKSVQNNLSIRLNGGKFIAKLLSNQNNIVKVEDASFLVDEVNGGEFTLNNIKKGLIGSISKAKLSAEFSNLEIGELQKGNNFKGFSNNILIHNFSDDFEQFDLFLEYSKVHYFKLKNDYELNAFGYNTLVNIDNVRGKIPLFKGNEKSKFFTIKRKGKGLFSGTMNFDITHGFIYIH